MKKKNRSMKFIISTIVLSLLIFSSMSFAKSEKKYPPYPDVWGHEIIIPDKSVTDAHINIIKMRDGDYMIRYIAKIKKLGKDFKFSRAGYLFFSGKKMDFGEDVKELQRISDEARAEKRYHSFIVVDFQNPKIVFSDGSIFESKARWWGGCHDPLSPGRYYLVMESNGRILKEGIFLSLLSKPVKEEIISRCERNMHYNEKYYYRRVGMAGGYLVPLEDDTFLMVSSFKDDKRIKIRIIRFNKDFTTKVDLMKYNLFMLDRSEYIGVIQKSKGDDNSNHEVVADYLLKLKKGGLKNGNSK